MTNGPSPTPGQNAQNIADLTAAVAATNAAVNGLVSQFIRPNAQQANTNRETLDEVIELLSRHTQGLLSLEQRLDQMVDRLESIEGIVAQNAQQQQANNQQIAAIGDRLEQYDQRLEETRAIVAENSSRIAQLSVKQDQLLDRIDAQQAETTETLNLLIEENRAFRESQQSQLAAIIGNARRIDRLEQQAS
ncbi:MAG: hypothetical protein AB8B99_11605 [Phormidesmis sp.]